MCHSEQWSAASSTFNPTGAALTRLMLENGADANLISETPILTADGKLDRLQNTNWRLASSGEFEWYPSPLVFADYVREHADVIRVLCEYGANIIDTNGKSALDFFYQKYKKRVYNQRSPSFEDDRRTFIKSWLAPTTAITNLLTYSPDINGLPGYMTTNGYQMYGPNPQATFYEQYNNLAGEKILEDSETPAAGSLFNLFTFTQLFSSLTQVLRGMDRKDERVGEFRERVDLTFYDEELLTPCRDDETKVCVAFCVRHGHLRPTIGMYDYKKHMYPATSHARITEINYFDGESDKTIVNPSYDDIMKKVVAVPGSSITNCQSLSGKQFKYRETRFDWNHSEESQYPLPHNFDDNRPPSTFTCVRSYFTKGDLDQSARTDTWKYFRKI